MPIDWSKVATDAVAPGLGAVAGLAGTVLNQFMPLSRAAKQAHQLNVEETMRQEARQEEFFNNYQSIGAQVRQMKGAGLNPALAAGGISAGSPASGPSTSGVSPQSADATGIILDTMRSLQEIRDAKQMRVQRNESHALEVEKTRAEINKTNEEADALRIENITRQRYNELRNQDLEQSITESKARVYSSSLKDALTIAETAAKNIDNETRGKINELRVKAMELGVEAQETNNGMLKEEAKHYAEQLANQLALQAQAIVMNEANIKEVKTQLNALYNLYKDEPDVLKQWDKDGIPLSRWAEMSDEELKALKKNNKLAWTKVANTVSGFVGAASAIGMLGLKFISPKALATPLVEQSLNGYGPASNSWTINSPGA